MKKLLILCTVFSVALMATPAKAQKWSSDDDIPVVTVKKKYFLKTGRSEVSAGVGFLFNDTFVNTLAFQGTYAYHISETFFLEGAGAFLSSSNSSSTDDLINNFGIQPDTDDMEYYAEARAGWSPIYGKLNFLSKKIVYFDTSLYAGGGITQAEISGLSPHVVFGLAQRFVLTKWVALRLDIRDAVILRDDAGVSGSIRNSLGFHAGLSFFFPLK